MGGDYLVEVLIGSCILQSLVAGVDPRLGALDWQRIAVHDPEGVSLDLAPKVPHHLDDASFPSMVEHLYQRKQGYLALLEINRAWIFSL